MAKIGLRYFRYSKLTEAANGTPSYEGAKKPAKAVSCNVDVTSNEAELYADDALAESDTSFQGGTVTMGIDDEDPETMAELLGHRYENGMIIRNADDAAPYIGLGRIVVKMVGGVYKYKVEFLYKTKFSEPSQEDTTKGEALEFGTSELEGKIAQLANGNWSASKTFNTLAAAQQFLDDILADDTAEYTITYDANGGTGTITPETVTKGQSVELDDGSGLTAPEGKTFAGWATTPDSASVLVNPYTPMASITLYAIYVAAE